MGTRAKIATVAFRAGHLGRRDQAAMVDYVFELVDGLRASRPDLICLPEEVLIAAGDKDNPQWAALNARLLEGLSARARAMGAMIECCAEEPSRAYPGKRYNTAYLIGRDGGMIGKYRKRYLTFRALEGSGIPGEALPVFDTDIGRIGLQTCFDIGWRPPWAALADKGCELVVWNAAYDGGYLLDAYAALHMYFIASSVWTDHARIIDPTGRVVCESSRWDGVAIAEVDLGMELYHADRQEDKPAQIRAALGDKVDIRSDSRANIFTVSSRDDAWPASRVREAFGLMTYKDYHAAYGRDNDRARVAYPEEP